MLYLIFSCRSTEINSSTSFFFERPVESILRLVSLTLSILISGTASDDIAAAIDKYKKGHPYKCDKDGVVNIGVGMVK